MTARLVLIAAAVATVVALTSLAVAHMTAQFGGP